MYSKSRYVIFHKEVKKERAHNRGINHTTRVGRSPMIKNNI